MFGTVHKTRSYTRFQIEVKLDNGCVVNQTFIATKDELAQFPDAYGLILDEMTSRLEQRIKERAQSWASQ